MNITFPIQRHRTNLQDVDAFIAEYANRKNSLVVEIDRAGVGDAFADRLESAGFTVRRFMLKRVY
jgi:hypothetical protein